MAESKLLLDTHALLWWATGDRALSQKIRRLMQDEATSVVVSAASAWEISTKVRLGRLTWAAQMSLEVYCAEQRFEVLPMTFAHAARAGSWTQDHGDPFDRMLAAQSEIEGLPLATNDRKISAFGIETIW
jgi:PIN domain nuclease of toxin-antitoxin system